MKQIDVSYDKDLRHPEWKVIDYKTENGLLVVTHLDPLNGKKYISKTRHAGYDDGFGNPVILYQEIWEEE